MLKGKKIKNLLQLRAGGWPACRRRAKNNYERNIIELAKDVWMENTVRNSAYFGHIRFCGGNKERDRLLMWNTVTKVFHISFSVTPGTISPVWPVHDCKTELVLVHVRLCCSMCPVRPASVQKKKSVPTWQCRNSNKALATSWKLKCPLS